MCSCSYVIVISINKLFIEDVIVMYKILKAILSGKSKKEVIGMMSDDEKAILTGVSKYVGLTRQQRRKMMRDAKK